MSLRNIIIEPDPILREKSLPVEKVDSDLQKLLNEIRNLNLENIFLTTRNHLIQDEEDYHTRVMYQRYFIDYPDYP